MSRNRAPRLIAIAGVLVVLLVPVAWTVLASFGLVPDTNGSPPRWPPPSLAAYSEIFAAEPDVSDELGTTAASAALATALAIAAAFLFANAMSRGRESANRRHVLPALLVLASLPAIAYVAPLGDFARRVHLDDTLAGVVLAEAAASAPLAAFVITAAVRRVPVELEHAALLDGGGTATVVARIVLPNVWPTIAATAIVVFVLNWNSLLVPLVLTAGHVRTITVAMSDFFTFERELEWPTAAAAIVFSLAPCVILVATLSRLLERFSLEPGTGS